jgi:cytochrome c oxidase assembly protein subunit 15
MPFDPAPASFRSAFRRYRRLIAAWLFTLSGMVFVMVVLGGATRLTGSGLSIMEWAPFSGALPPLHRAEWDRLFALYRTIPQARLLHPDMDLSGFQRIFWLEWVHRLWGRLLGLVLFAPLLVFAVRGAIPRWLGMRMAVLFVLGGLQGAVGWFMVASGFEAGSTAVSAGRLVAHLLLALALYAALLWTALSVLRPLRLYRRPAAMPAVLAIAVAGVTLTIAAGGLVAGLHAGLAYNTFPLMDGQLIPAGYHALPWPRNLVENIAAVQFNHRALATLTLSWTVGTALAGLLIHRTLPVPLRWGLWVMVACVGLQYALGVATLLAVVPIPLAVAHQAGAVLLLSAALCCLHFATRAGFQESV